MIQRLHLRRWMYKNQRGKRNLTEEQDKLIVGEEYTLNKIISQQRDEKGVFKDNAPRDAFDPTDDKSHATAKAIAEEHKISESKVRRYADFRDGVNAIKEHEPEAG